MYRIQANLEIDFEDVLHKLTPKTRVLYVTHFFGWPQQIEPIREEIVKRGIRILEDCALSLFSCDEDVGSRIGRIGDAAIYSFPKTLAVPDGGAVTSPTPLENTVHLGGSPSNALILRRCLPFLKRFVLDRVPGAQRLHKLLNRGIEGPGSIKGSTKDPGMPENYYFDERKCNDGMSSLSMGLLKRVDRREVKRIRQENYRLLLEGIRSVPGIRVLKPDLPEDVCPLSMPIQVNDRDQLRQALMARGIYTYPWWAGYHRRMDWSEFPEARRLKDTVLTLPVHQGLGSQHMEYITEVLREASAKTKIS
jgi:dTDP-4-amino-4,6-dideoxygalactose transaminase